MNNFLSDGENITLVASGAVVKNTVAVLEDRCGIYEQSAASGDSVTVLLEGVVTLAKATTDTFTAGKKVYWNSSASQVTGSAGSFKALGHTAEAQATSGQATVKVKLGTF